MKKNNIKKIKRKLDKTNKMNKPRFDKIEINKFKNKLKDKKNKEENLEKLKKEV